MSILNSFVNGKQPLHAPVRVSGVFSDSPYQISSSVLPLRLPSSLPTTRSRPSHPERSRPLFASSSQVNSPSTLCLKAPRLSPSTPRARNRRACFAFLVFSLGHRICLAFGCHDGDWPSRTTSCSESLNALWMVCFFYGGNVLHHGSRGLRLYNTTLKNRVSDEMKSCT